jgi:transcriptional regulator with XRE-family HTH domain
MTATQELAALRGGERGQDDTGTRRPTSFSRELGGWLRLHRRLRGLLADDVERLSGGQWKAGTLKSWELGHRAIKPETLAGLARFYRVDVTDFLPEYGPVLPRMKDLTPCQRKILALLGTRAAPFTAEAVAAALPAWTRQGIRRSIAGLRDLGLVIAPAAAGAARVGLTRAGRKVLERA